MKHLYFRSVYIRKSENIRKNDREDRYFSLNIMCIYKDHKLYVQNQSKGQIFHQDFSIFRFFFDFEFLVLLSATCCVFFRKYIAEATTQNRNKEKN